jgi:hypothetical protein
MEEKDEACDELGRVGRKAKDEGGTRKFHAETRRRFFYGGILRVSVLNGRRDTSEPFPVYLGHLPSFLSSAREITGRVSILI